MQTVGPDKVFLKVILCAVVEEVELHIDVLHVTINHVTV